MRRSLCPQSPNMGDIRSGFQCLYWPQHAWHQSLGLLHTSVTGILTPLLLKLVKEPKAYVSIAQNLSHRVRAQGVSNSVEQDRLQRAESSSALTHRQVSQMGKLKPRSESACPISLSKGSACHLSPGLGTLGTTSLPSYSSVPPRQMQRLRQAREPWIIKVCFSDSWHPQNRAQAGG